MKATHFKYILYYRSYTNFYCLTISKETSLLIRYKNILMRIHQTLINSQSTGHERLHEYFIVQEFILPVPKSKASPCVRVKK